MLFKIFLQEYSNSKSHFLYCYHQDQTHLLQLLALIKVAKEDKVINYYLSKNGPFLLDYAAEISRALTY